RGWPDRHRRGVRGRGRVQWIPRYGGRCVSSWGSRGRRRLREALSGHCVTRGAGPKRISPRPRGSAIGGRATSRSTAGGLGWGAGGGGGLARGGGGGRGGWGGGGGRWGGGWFFLPWGRRSRRARGVALAGGVGRGGGPARRTSPRPQGSARGR